jgi:hypothetical protein
MRTTFVRILLFSLATPLLAQAEAPIPGNQLPGIGSRIRVTAPSLNPGWHVGMLNRRRVEPVCYTVLIFGSPDKNEVTAMLTLGEITQIQVSNLYNNGHASYDPAKPFYPEEKWSEVSLEALRSTNKCRKD